MPLELQAKLLRVLESGEFNRVGDSKATKVDVRLIAATNKNLRHQIENGHFREDLFYRISAFQINLPALRERLSDIEVLAQHFLVKAAGNSNKRISSMSPDYVKALTLHSWPGNIRELKNVIERCVILADGDTLHTETLPVEMQHAATLRMGKELPPLALANAEKLHIQKVLAHTNGNKTEAARLLGIGIATLYRKIEAYRIA
jgi:DNA-binding NtrC family response regulator